MFQTLKSMLSPLPPDGEPYENTKERERPHHHSDDTGYTTGDYTQSHISPRSSESRNDTGRSEGNRGETTNVIPIEHTVRGSAEIFAPNHFDDWNKRISNSFIQGNFVVLNMENLVKNLQNDLMMFLAGLVYGLGGEVQKISENCMLFVPHNCTVSEGSLKEITASLQQRL